MVQTIPAEVKSTNFLFNLDTKIFNFTHGYTITYFLRDMVEI